MCREGINLTQFKLAINHLMEEVELSRKGAAQWQVVLHSPSLNELRGLLDEVDRLLGESVNKLQAALKKASELAASEIDGVEITTL